MKINSLLKTIFFTLTFVFVLFPNITISAEIPAGLDAWVKNAQTNPSVATSTTKFVPPKSAVKLSTEDEYYLTQKAGQTNEDFLLAIQNENKRRQALGAPIISGTETFSTTQIPANNGKIQEIGDIETSQQIIDGIKAYEDSLSKKETEDSSMSKYNSEILNQIVPSSAFKGQNMPPLSKVLNQLFYIGLLVAVVLAIVMIIRGGIEYMTTDAIYSKESGKNRVKAALGGLLLAFSTILILNTINPNLTKLSLVFEKLQGIDSTELEGIITNAVNQYTPADKAKFEEMLRTGKIPQGLSVAGQKILAEALNSIENLKTGAIPGTDGGNKACAAAVNKIVESATGQQVGGKLSTAAMYEDLKKNNRFVLVPGGIQSAQPGDIIISPSSGGKTGHVGIVASQGARSVISNSSSKAEVRNVDYAPGKSWDKYYGAKGLETHIYRPL